MQHVQRETQFTNCGPIDYRGLYGDHVAANTNNRADFRQFAFPFGCGRPHLLSGALRHDFGKGADEEVGTTL